MNESRLHCLSLSHHIYKAQKTSQVNVACCYQEKRREGCLKNFAFTALSIKGRALGKLTGCEYNLPGCFDVPEKSFS